VGLQIDDNVEEDLSGLCSDTCPVSSQDAGQVKTVIVEEEKEAVPVPITWEAIKAEHDVSCMPVCMPVWPLLSRFDKYTKLHIVILVSLCPSICLHETDLL
jgi:hypothetical protein